MAASCIIWIIVVAILVTGLAWLIPPTRAYCLMIGAVCAVLGALGCIAGVV